MDDEYLVRTRGGSAFDHLERVGERLADFLNGREAAGLMAQGWELWQTHLLNGHQGIHGLAPVFRRPKAPTV